MHMRFDMEEKQYKVFIAGGTGFIGYHAAKLFLEKGFSVDTIALPSEINLGNWYPKEIKLFFGDLFLMSEEAIFQLISKNKYDVFVYALGPDDRVIPKTPAWNFFYDRLVIQATKVCQAAKRAGIKKCIVLNSYFSYFDKLNRGLLSRNHPYIKARVEQIKAIKSLSAPNEFETIFLELPFIFGTMPNRKPLWKEHFLDQFSKMKMVMFPSFGGTAAIDVSGVAEAIVASALYGKTGEYPIGQINISYKSLIKLMMKSIGDKRAFLGVPGWICFIWAKRISRNLLKKGLESGLRYEKLMTQILNKRFFIDMTSLKKQWNYQQLGFFGGEDVLQSIQLTIKKCYEDCH